MLGWGGIREEDGRLFYFNPLSHVVASPITRYGFHVLPTQCIYVFCTDLRTNSDYFPVKH